MLVIFVAWLPLTTNAAVDRGEPGRKRDELALGPDVRQTLGEAQGKRLAGAELHRRTEALAAKMRCPVCQGNAIVDSPAEAARNMKRQIRAMLAAGYREEQIFNYFEASYGEFIRLLPRAQGLNLMLWLLPIGALVVGLFVVIYSLRRAKGVATAPPLQSEEIIDQAEEAKWLSRVHEEVDRR